MAKVYVPQVPSRLDHERKIWVPSVNLHPAEKYGKIEVILPPEANRLHVAALVPAIKEAMKEFTEDDFVVAVGDPSILAIVTAIAAQKTRGILRLLKWDRMTSDYIPVEIKL